MPIVQVSPPFRWATRLGGSAHCRRLWPPESTSFHNERRKGTLATGPLPPDDRDGTNLGCRFKLMRVDYASAEDNACDAAGNAEAATTFQGSACSPPKAKPDSDSRSRLWGVSHGFAYR